MYWSFAFSGEGRLDFRLERIVVPSQAQLDGVYQLACAAPGYWQLTEGKRSPGREAVAAWFDGSDLPPGKSLGEQHALGVWVGEELVGMATVLRSWPYPDQAMIKLLLLSERWQGRGLGRRIFAELEQLVLRWPRISTLRISIIASNAPAFAFWRKLGFAETGERKREHGFLADAVVLEKPLPVMALGCC
ncbi:hypothetical protein GCM10007907_14330 [Chitinimonas prasina]|uniref:N-acetyltransferase domain-containing protein n=1 Tax=Chitinimonas prasina TaxID=1434937 RepID=A0ABQ5YDT2_9NEIS|nr:hypothetical protein GCM10007907_14330 [Chitinimonas prasina]